MDKFGPIIFAVLLFAGGAAIIGKTLLGRPKGAVAFPAGCPPVNELKLTDEVRAYIDQELKVTEATASSVDPATLLTNLVEIEKTTEDLWTASAKSKEFMDRLVRYSKDFSDWDNNRQDRLGKDRIAYGMDIMNDAVAKCGIKRWVYKPQKEPTAPNPGTSPPQPAPAK